MSPLVFGVVLDGSNPSESTYTSWGWAFSVFGVGGMGAIWTAYRLQRVPRHKTSVVSGE